MVSPKHYDGMHQQSKTPQYSTEQLDNKQSLVR